MTARGIDWGRLRVCMVSNACLHGQQCVFAWSATRVCMVSTGTHVSQRRGNPSIPSRGRTRHAIVEVAVQVAAEQQRGLAPGQRRRGRNLIN